MNKSGEIPVLVTLIAAIVIGGGILFVAAGAMGWTSFSLNMSGEEGDIEVNCDSTTTPNLTIKAYDQENVGTPVTETTNLYRKVGQTTWSTFTQGSGFDVEFNEQYDVVMGISTTDFTDNAYGPMFTTDKIACKETITIEQAVANDEVEGSVSATFYNADDNAAAETFSTGQTQTVSIKLQTGTDEYFGNPFIDMAKCEEGQRGDYPNVLALSLNSSEWDKPEQVYIVGGAELSQITCPTILESSATTSGYTEYCYEMPVIGDKEVRIKMDLNADDTNTPGNDGTAYLYAGNWFYNTDDGEIHCGVENEEDAAVGVDAPDEVTLDFTA
jgi:hypothetical protein